MATERIQIIISERGGRVVRSVLRGLGAEATRARPAVESLKASLAGLASGVALAQLSRMSDEVIRLRNRLTFVTGDTQSAAAVFGMLQKAADDTRSSLAATGDLYTRFALATRHMGLTSGEVVDIVKGLNQAVILSGANAREAEAGLLQFSQGLASNRLAGDELRAVLEQLPLLADIIGKELGVTRGALRYLAREGEITADVVVRAMQKMAKQLEEDFQETVPTIGQAFIVLRNSVLRVLNDIDRGTGVFGGLAKAIIALSKHMDVLARVVIAGVLVAALYAAVAAVTALTAAVAANPLGALIMAITTVSALLVTFSDKIVVIQSHGVTLRDVLVAAFQEIWAVARPIFQAIRDWLTNDLLPTLGQLPGTIYDTVKSIAKTVAENVDLIFATFAGIWGALQEGFRSLPVEWQNVYIKIINSVIQFADDFIDLFVAIFKTVKRTFTDFVEKTLDSLGYLGESMTALLDGNFTEAKKAAQQALTTIRNAVTNTTNVFLEEYQKGLSDERFAKLKKATKSSGKDLGTALLDGFESAFDRVATNGPAQRLVESLFGGRPGALKGVHDFIARIRARAIEVAQERQMRNAEIDARNLRAAEEEEGLKDLRAVKIETETERLRAQLNVLEGITRERRVQSALLRVEEKLKPEIKSLSDLTDAERLNLEVIIRKKEALDSMSQALAAYAEALGTSGFAVDTMSKIQDKLNVQIGELILAWAGGEITVEQLNTALDALENNLSNQAQAYADIKDPIQAYLDRMAALDEIAKIATTDLERNNIELEKTRARIELLEGRRDARSGFERGILKLQEEWTNFGKLAEDTLVNAFRAGEDALVQFITTGKSGFRDLAQSIAQDLVRLGIRQFITSQLLNAFGAALQGGNLTGAGSGGSGGGGGGGGSGRAGGGPVFSGETYVVGEHGPEILSMGDRRGYVSNARDSARLGGGDVYVTINLPGVKQPRDWDNTKRQILREVVNEIRRNR